MFVVCCCFFHISFCIYFDRALAGAPRCEYVRSPQRKAKPGLCSRRVSNQYLGIDTLVLIEALLNKRREARYSSVTFIIQFHGLFSVADSFLRIVDEFHLCRAQEWVTK